METKQTNRLAESIEQSVKSLNTGEKFIIPESDYGKAEIWKIHDYYFVFEIPMFGGQPFFYKKFPTDEIQNMINEINKLT